MANSLDYKRFRQRTIGLASIRAEASELRQTCTDANKALGQLDDFLERIVDLTYEVYTIAVMQ